VSTSGRYAPKLGTRPDAAVARRAARQWGVVSLDELRACGLTERAVSRRVGAGRLHPLYRGVYAVGHTNLRLEGHLLAAVKACGPAAVVSHYSAAALYGLVKWDDRYPEVTAPRAAAHRGIRAHRSALQREDLWARKGIPATTPARTLVDLSSLLPYDPLRRAAREAQAQKLVTIAEIVKALDRAGRKRGTANLARIIATGPAPTRSELEDAVLDLILAGGLQSPQVNQPITIQGQRVTPDFRWPTQRLVLEADGARWHDHKLASEDDRERQAILEAAGERVVRVTWDQAIRQRSQTLARIRQAGAPTLDGP
jgi:very-short-patch-repair endonuclease/predicted transcriptional regulator of viral defense system